MQPRNNIEKNTFFVQTSFVRRSKMRLKSEKQRNKIELTVLHGRRENTRKRIK